MVVDGYLKNEKDCKEKYLVNRDKEILFKLNQKRKIKIANFSLTLYFTLFYNSTTFGIWNLKI